MQFVIPLLVPPGTCISTVAQVPAKTPRAFALPVLLLPAEAACERAGP